MEYTAPQAEIVTDKTKAENAKVIQLRNNATILEAEISRLKELIASENYTISQLIQRKAELETMIPELEARAKTLQEKVKSLEEAIVTLEKGYTELKANIKNDEEKALVAQKQRVELDAITFARIEELNKEKTVFVAEKEIFEVKNKELESRITQLKNIIN